MAKGDKKIDDAVKFKWHEHVFWIVCVTIIIVFSGLLYADMNKSGGVGQGKPVGVLTYKIKSAQRKFKAQVIWEDVEQKVLLYNNDSIRTSEKSSATITLNNGTKISLDDNSMIVLAISDKNVAINYTYGSIQAKNGSGPDAAELTIKTTDNKTISIKDSDVKLSSDKGKKLNVVVKKGTASVTVGKQKQEIKKNQVAIISEKKIDIKPLNLRLRSPADNSRVFTDKNKTAVGFSWDPIKGNSKVSLEISSNRFFIGGVKRSTARGAGTSRSLKSGIYYWRISAKNAQSGKKEFSGTNKIALIRKDNLRLTSPGSGSSFSYVNAKPMVSFSWSKAEYAESYVVEVSKSSNFSNPTKLKTRSTYISQRLDAGSYFCRVSSISSQAAAGTRSPTVRFSVLKRKDLPPPNLYQPAKGKQISRIILEKQGVLFNWGNSRELGKSEIWISSNKGFSGKTSRKVGNNFYSLRQKLKTGTYYWKVRGLGSDGEPRTTFSGVRTFTVVKTAKVALVEPSPGLEINLFSSKGSGINFAWRRAGLIGKYRITISRNKNLSNPIRKQQLGKVATTIRKLKAGTYFWGVSLLGDGGLTLSSSNVRSFRITENLQTPTAIYPTPGTIVDMSFRDDLPFRWSRAVGAERYRIRLYYLKPGGGRQTVFTRTLGGTEFKFRNLLKLKKGRFAWSVSAIRKSKGKSIKSNAKLTQFRITLSQEPEKTDVISPGEQYIQ